jgi:NAD(P)-dependent dehydrogenase (short-subunit alcohol dehydrogenase family)
MNATDKTAVVTGGSAGIGRAAAIALLKDGWSVAIGGRRGDALDETLALAGDDGARGLSVPGDLSMPEGCANLFAKTRERFGQVDLLFNNAGIFTPGVPLEDLTPEQWQAAVNINLSSFFYCTQEAFRVFKARDPMGGRIINNGSISAHAPRPYSAPYTSTKHAITGLTKSCSLDGRKFNIAVGQIDIGNAATEMTKAMEKGVPQADGSRKPEPTMDVSHIANAVVHMANLPLDANVQFMTIMATKMPFVGRG